MKLYFVIALVFGIGLIGSAFGHQCIECKDFDYESEGEHCEEIPVACDESWQSQKYCMLEVHDEGARIYRRGCMPNERKCNPGEIVDVRSQLDKQYNLKTYYGCCEGDLCNAPKRLSASKLMSSANKLNWKISSANKLTSKNVLFTSILLGLVISAASWMFNWVIWWSEDQKLSISLQNNLHVVNKKSFFFVADDSVSIHTYMQQLLLKRYY